MARFKPFRFLTRLRKMSGSVLLALALGVGAGTVGRAQTVKPPAAQKPGNLGMAVGMTVMEEKGLERLQPNAAIFAFGKVDRFTHPTLEHTFTIRNEGKTPLVIDHLQPSCGCTSALLTSGKEAAGYTLEPGKQVGVKVTVDLTKLAPGAIKKFLWVMLPHENTPAVSIRLDAEIEGVLTFEPPSLEFGRVEAGKSPGLNLQVTLDRRLINTLGGVKLISSNPGVVISPASPTDTPVPGGNGQTVQRTYTVAVTPKADLGVLSGTLSFVPAKSSAVANKTNAGSAAETAATLLANMTVPLSGQVLGSISSRPGTVVFGAVTQGDETTRRITIVGTTEASLKDLQVVCSSAWVTAKLSSPARPKPSPTAPPLPPMLLLEVTLNAKTPPGAIETKVVLTTQAGARLVLPAFGYVTPVVK